MKKTATKTTCLIVLALALLVSALSPALGEDTAVASGITLTEVYRSGVFSSALWLGDRDRLQVRTSTSPAKAGVITPDGEPVFILDSAPRYFDYEGYGYFTVGEEDGLNKTGLMNSSGALVIPCEYFKILLEVSDSYAYGFAVFAETTEEEDYDWDAYLGGDKVHCNLVYVDVYDLTAGTKLGTLSREEINQVRGYPDGFLVEDRVGALRWYDRELNFVKPAEKERFDDYLHPFQTVDSGFETAIARADAMDTVGETMSGYSYEGIVSEKYYKIRSNATGCFGLMDAEGNVLVPCEFSDSRNWACDGEYAIVASKEGLDTMYGIYHVGKGLAVPCIYDAVRLCPNGHVACHGYALVRQDQSLKYVNMSGEVTCVVDVSTGDRLTEMGTCIVRVDLDGNSHIIAADGMVTATDFEISTYTSSSFNPCGRLLMAENADGLLGIIDCYGNTVYDFTIKSGYDCVFSPSHEYVYVTTKEASGGNVYAVYQINE